MQLTLHVWAHMRIGPRLGCRHTAADFVLARQANTGCNTQSTRVWPHMRWPDMRFQIHTSCMQAAGQKASRLPGSAGRQVLLGLLHGQQADQCLPGSAGRTGAGMRRSAGRRHRHTTQCPGCSRHDRSLGVGARRGGIWPQSAAPGSGAPRGDACWTALAGRGPSC